MSTPFNPVILTRRTDANMSAEGSGFSLRLSMTTTWTRYRAGQLPIGASDQRRCRRVH